MMRQGRSAVCLSKSCVHIPTEESPPVHRSTSNTRLEPSPLSRPHPRMQLRPSAASYGVRPHPSAVREKLFASESTCSSSSKQLPPSLEFSPGDLECSPPASKGFQLGVAAESSLASAVTSSPSRKSSSLRKKAKQGKR